MTAAVVSTVRKNSRENLRIGLSHFEGYDLCGLRVWYLGQDGIERPGKQGVTFRVALLPEIRAALDEAIDEARRQGLLD